MFDDFLVSLSYAFILFAFSFVRILMDELESVIYCSKRTFDLNRQTATGEVTAVF